MGKAKRKTRTARIIEPGDLPTVEQLRNGRYDKASVTHVETQTTVVAHKSLRDPILRWEKDRKLTDMQASTIRRMQALWQAVYGTQKLVGRYEEPVAASTSETSDARLAALRDDLRRIEGYFDGLRQWYSTFERVCRFGLTGPEACETASVTERASRDRALVVVCFIADYIQTRERW